LVFQVFSLLDFGPCPHLVLFFFGIWTLALFGTFFLDFGSCFYLVLLFFGLWPLALFSTFPLDFGSWPHLVLFFFWTLEFGSIWCFSFWFLKLNE